MRRVAPRNTRPQFPQLQTRSLFVKQPQALDMLKQKSIAVNDAAPSESDIYLSLAVDRTALTPCVLASIKAGFEPSHTACFPFPYTTTEFNTSSPLIETIASHLQLPETSRGQLAHLVQALWQIFKDKEAYLLEVRANPSTQGTLEVRGARFGFDDAAFRSSGRQEEVHKLRRPAEEVPEEVEAEKDGIVYVKYVITFPKHLDPDWLLTKIQTRLDGPGSIGTLGRTFSFRIKLRSSKTDTVSSERRWPRNEHSRRTHLPWRPVCQLP